MRILFLRKKFNCYKYLTSAKHLGLLHKIFPVGISKLQFWFRTLNQKVLAYWQKIFYMFFRKAFYVSRIRFQRFLRKKSISSQRFWTVSKKVQLSSQVVLADLSKLHSTCTCSDEFSKESTLIRGFQDF